VRPVRTGPGLGLSAAAAGQVALLAVLAATVGLGPLGWVAGLACAVGIPLVLAVALRHFGADRLGAANRVTLARAVLVGAVAALVADSYVRGAAVATMTGLAAAALALDAVDGPVARATGSVTEVGGRFDMELDAFLILVLSAYAARTVGPWVVPIGLARYLFLAAGLVRPWLRRQLPARFWRKPVAAIQGIVLTVAMADVLPRALSDIAIAVALALLAESFGRDVLWLWRTERAARREPPEPPWVTTQGTTEGTAPLLQRTVAPGGTNCV
jgi:phosphatidylglycerophosphate synthase